MDGTKVSFLELVEKEVKYFPIQYLPVNYELQFSKTYNSV